MSAETSPGHPALHIGARTITYSALVDAASALGTLLKDLTTRSGVLIYTKKNRETYLSTFT